MIYTYLYVFIVSSSWKFALVIWVTLHIQFHRKLTFENFLQALRAHEVARHGSSMVDENEMSAKRQGVGDDGGGGGGGVGWMFSKAQDAKKRGEAEYLSKQREKAEEEEEADYLSKQKERAEKE